VAFEGFPQPSNAAGRPVRVPGDRDAADPTKVSAAVAWPEVGPGSLCPDPSATWRRRSAEQADDRVIRTCRPSTAASDGDRQRWSGTAIRS